MYMYVPVMQKPEASDEWLSQLFSTIFETESLTELVTHQMQPTDWPASPRHPPGSISGGGGGGAGTTSVCHHAWLFV